MAGGRERRGSWVAGERADLASLTSHFLRAALAPALACGLMLLAFTAKPGAARPGASKPDSLALLSGAAMSNSSAVSFFAARLHSEVNNWAGTHFGMDILRRSPSSNASFPAARTNF